MAKIIGQSDCTALLTKGLQRCGLHSVHLFTDIEHFFKNFNRILENAITYEKTQLDNEIASLMLKVRDLTSFVDELTGRFRRLLAKIKRWMFQNRAKKLQNNYNTIISKQVSHLHRAWHFLNEYISFYYGAIGEEAVIKELSTLPDSYVVCNTVKIAFNRAILWKKYGEYVKTSQIDHIVVGPPGVFLIETKNWGGSIPENALYYPPLKQIKRAEFAFYVKIVSQFRYKVPIFKIIVMIKKCTMNYIDYTQILSLKDLNAYILSRSPSISLQNASQIVNWIYKGI